MPSVTLGDEKPIKLLGSRFGAAMVMDELGRRPWHPRLMRLYRIAKAEYITDMTGDGARIYDGRII